MSTPFVKWAGGKGKDVATILDRLPDRIETYYEPFVGGGAVFFALAKEQPRRFKRAVIGDTARELIEAYAVVKHQAGPLIAALTKHARRAHDAEYFYRIRDEVDPDELDPVQRAARFIFLNKTCFNGLYRVNRKGRFNVPHGRPANGEFRVFDAEELRATSLALRRCRTSIACADFEELIGSAKRGDAVYFDPPYLGSFAGYNPEPFTPFDHQRLASAFRWLCNRKVDAVLSSSDTRGARRIYSGLELVSVRGHRAIAQEGSARDLLIVGMGRD